MAAARSNGHAGNGAKKNYAIHVTNIPLGLEQESIQNLFERYGETTACMTLKKKDGTQEAFISYASYAEAETAINEMNGKAPLELQVEFKDKDLRAQKDIDIKVELDKPFIDYRYQDIPVDELAHAKKAINMGRPKCTPSPYQVNNYTVDDDLLCPVPTDPSMCNPYEPPGPYKDLNLMYSRGMTTILADGRKRICFGRGYTFYDLPEPHHNIGNLVSNVCEIRNSSAYEYAPDDLDDDSGLCKICSTPTAFRCQKCSVTFYCSRPCQLKDWPQHKIDCQSIPNLVKRIPSAMSLQNGNGAPKQNGPEAPARNQVDKNQIEPETHLRRPRPLPPHHHHQQPLQHRQNQQHERQQSPPRCNRNQQLQQSPPHFNRNQQQQRSPPNARQDKTTPKSPASVKSHRSSDDTNRQTPVTAFKAESTSFPVKQQQSPTKPKSTPSDDGISFVPNEWFISKDTFERVLITTKINDGDYYVQKVAYCKNMDEMFTNLEKRAKTTTARMQPFPNLKCIIEHEGHWYRVTVKDIRNDMMTVFFLDFGSFAEVKVSDVIPIDGFETSYYARRIFFAENTDPKFMSFDTEKTMYVKAIAIDDNGAFTVEVKEDVDESASESKGPSPPVSQSVSVPASPRQPSPWQIAVEKLMSCPNILSTLKIGESVGLIMLHANIAKDELVASLVPKEFMNEFESLIEDLAATCNSQVAQNPDYEPIVGDYICGQQSNGDWYRGIVIHLNPIKLAVIDEARVFVPVKCTPLPKGYHDIPNFGVIAKLTAAADVAGKTLVFQTLKISPSKDSAVISLAAEDEPAYTGEAILTKWTPKAEQKGIQWVKLTSGREVQIIDAFSQNMIFVHSKEPEEIERRHRLEQEIAKCALNRKPLPDLPVVGQIVMAYYENDGNYYRAYVVRVESKTNIQIKYMDFGNDANVKFEHLFELPEQLKEERACSARIKLKGVEENIPMTSEATDYLTELITHEVALTCTFTGNPAIDGVVLKTPRNDIVNETLSAFLEPTWEKPPQKLEDKPVFTMNDLPALKIGDVGDQLQAISLCFYGTPLPTVMLAPNDETVVTAIQGDMLERIQEYVKNTPEHYIPRDGELCIALYDGAYFRGVCMCTSATPDQSRIMFIDYGNTEVVKHKDIRIMVKDFMDIGPLATLCSLSPMVPDDKVTPAIRDRLSELMPVNDLITVKIISEDPKDGMPYIDVPEVRVKLIEEKLL